MIRMSIMSNMSNNPTTTKNSNLARDLSELGQILANRMDWEDKLIQNYLRLTKEQRAEASPAQRASNGQTKLMGAGQDRIAQESGEIEERKEAEAGKKMMLHQKSLKKPRLEREHSNEASDDYHKPPRNLVTIKVSTAA